MPRSIGVVFCLLPVLTGCGRQEHIRDLAELREAPLYTFNEQELDVYLRWLADRPLSPMERIELLARKNIDQPYRIYLLGEHPFELYDADPMYCLSASDCVTFVEHTYAMAMSNDWPSFFRTLQRIRYKDGKVGMLMRNHFTEADWNINNAWLFDDVTEALIAEKARPMTAAIDRAAFFRKKIPGFDQDVPIQHFESAYIAREDLPEILPLLRTGDVVEFVKGNNASQYVSHMGLVIRTEDGTVSLVHSAEPSVREVPLLDYVDRHDAFLGVKFLRTSLQIASIAE